MVIKYVGRKTDFCGKTLWEIVGNLKNFGVGRLVKRQMFERYPEPSFLRILQVDPVAQEGEEPRKVRVWAEKVFRGQRDPKVVEVFSVSYKADYQLIPKTEEKNIWARVEATPPRMKLIPDSIEFPPLLKHLIQEDSASKGKNFEHEKLKVKIRPGRNKMYAVASEGQEVSFPPLPEFNFTYIERKKK